MAALITQLPLEIEPQRVAAFCDSYGVCELAVFGSVLRDDFGPDSDVDVMLDFLPGHGFTFENTPDIQDELASIFGRRVDVIEKGRIRNPIRRAAIMGTYRVIYAT